MPHPTDIFVGRKVREARALRGMSQEQLAASLGVSFQQVQKYEKGTNRIGSSRLFDISQTLQQPVPYFFNGLKDNNPETEPLELSASAIKLAKKIAELPADARRPLLNFINQMMD